MLAVAPPASSRRGAGILKGGLGMYLARFSYSVLPANRQRAIAFIHREVEAAARVPLKARMLVPLTRGQGSASLQFEVEIDSLDQFDQFRERGIDSDKETAKWMHAFSEILISPPIVELLRIQDS
jgi:hypothetical protein